MRFPHLILILIPHNLCRLPRPRPVLGQSLPVQTLFMAGPQVREGPPKRPQDHGGGLRSGELDPWHRLHLGERQEPALLQGDLGPRRQHGLSHGHTLVCGGLERLARQPGPDLCQHHGAAHLGD